jgi:hypothetical protein
MTLSGWRAKYTRSSSNRFWVCRRPLDLAARAMSSLFQNEPAYTPYNFLPNEVPVDGVVPQAAALHGMAKR